ncbi:MAG TPA: GAF domain-containing protein [Candidatus Binatia bacterium]
MSVYDQVISSQQGEAPLRIIALFAVTGLATSLLVFLRYDSIFAVDPILIFLLVAYPFLIGMTIYFYLEDKKVSATLQDEYYVKWYLQSFAKVCLSETDPQIFREELAGTILRLIRPALVMVYEGNADSQRLELVEQAGLKGLPDSATYGYAFGDGIPGWVMQNHNPAVLTDTTQEEHFQIDSWAKAMNFRSYAAVPIMVAGNAVGVVAMYGFEPNYFQDSNLLVAQLAVQIYGLSIAES